MMHISYVWKKFSILFLPFVVQIKRNLRTILWPKEIPLYVIQMTCYFSVLNLLHYLKLPSRHDLLFLRSNFLAMLNMLNEIILIVLSELTTFTQLAVISCINSIKHTIDKWDLRKGFYGLGSNADVERNGVAKWLCINQMWNQYPEMGYRGCEAIYKWG